MSTEHKVMVWLAKRLPKRFVYWVLIMVGTTPGMMRNDEVVPEVPFTLVLNRWHR